MNMASFNLVNAIHSDRVREASASRRVYGDETVNWPTDSNGATRATLGTDWDFSFPSATSAR